MKRLIPVVMLALLGALGWGLVHSYSSRPDPSTAVPSSVSSSAPAIPAPVDRAVRTNLPPPVRIRIPAIGVNAPVTPEGVVNGTIQVPPLSNHNLAGWFDEGPAPGENGSAVIFGHVNSYTGPSVFYSLKNLKPGERIYVTLKGGQTKRFTVYGIQDAAKDAFPVKDVFGYVPYPALRLVTCGGPFDYSTGHYLDNIIVYAKEG